MHRVGVGGQIVVGRLPRPRLRRCWSCECAVCRPCGGAAAGHERALEESTPLAVQVLKQLLSMQLKLRALPIITCAHDSDSSLMNELADVAWKISSNNCASLRAAMCATRRA